MTNNLDELVELIPENKPDKHTCYICGYEGRAVNHAMPFHVGGRGDVWFPICDDTNQCGVRYRQRNFCKNCGGILLDDDDFLRCLQCNRPHTFKGNLIKPRQMAVERGGYQH